MERVAVVTGSNRGIGKAIAEGLADAGLRVLATTRANLDVTSDASVEAFARTLDGLDVLVDNAGVALDGFDADVARKTLDVNFVGTMRVTDRLLPLFRPNARIVMVSSGMGELSSVGPELRRQFEDPSLDRAGLVALVDRFVDEVRAGTHAKSGWPSNAYRISKLAMNTYVRILARELASDPRRILVNAACPGWVRTRMGGRSAPRSPEEGARTPIWLALLPEGGPSGGFFRDEHAISF